MGYGTLQLRVISRRAVNKGVLAALIDIQRRKSSIFQSIAKSVCKIVSTSLESKFGVLFHPRKE